MSTPIQSLGVASILGDCRNRVILVFVEAVAEVRVGFMLTG